MLGRDVIVHSSAANGRTADFARDALGLLVGDVLVHLAHRQLHVAIFAGNEPHRTIVALVSVHQFARNHRAAFAFGRTMQQINVFGKLVAVKNLITFGTMCMNGQLASFDCPLALVAPSVHSGALDGMHRKLLLANPLMAVVAVSTVNGIRGC